MPRPHSFRTVVFDAVGTLIYPDPAVASIYASIGRKFGSRLTEPEIAERFQAVFRSVEARDCAGNLRTSEEFEVARWQEIVGRVLDDMLDHDAGFAELFAHFARPSSWRVFPEVPAVLSLLQSRGVLLAVASNFDRRLFEIARGLKPLTSCHHVLVSSEIGYRKPHPMFFQATLAAVGGKPQDVVYVGDDLHNDIQAARSVGMHAVLLDRHGSVGERGIAGLSELARYLNL